MPKVVVIIKTGALGDVLRTTAQVGPLRAKYADCELWWVTAKGAKSLVETHPAVDKVLTLEEATSALHQVDIELLISLEDDPECAKLVSSLSAKKVTGAVVDELGRLGYTEDSAPWFGMGILNRDPDGSLKTADTLKAENRETCQLLIAKCLSLDLSTYPKGFETFFHVTDEDLGWAAEHLVRAGSGSKRPLIGFNPSSGARWTAKRLGIERSVEVARALHEEFKTPIVLFGGPEESERQSRFIELADFPVIDAGVAHSLPEFGALVAQVDVLVTSDSLALHVATGTKRKVVAFFGPTSPHEIELYGKGAKLVPPGECVCFYQKECPNDCIDSIPVEDFVSAVQDVLG